MGYVLGFEQIDSTNVADVGGKGAHLGELSRIDGIRVPGGFCVTTDAFRRVVAEAPSIGARLDLLSRVEPDDRAAIRTLSADIRRVVEGAAIPDDLAAAIGGSLARLGERASYAVRSSATAEDLPTASFAGQQDSYLNIVGPAAVLRHVRRCWASLFTERAVAYRCRNGFDHRKVRMAVVVQQMVFPDAAGVLFTADPVTSNRKVATVEAGWGLGEALVSGLVSGDVYTVRDDRVVATAVAVKPRLVRASPGGGTQDAPVEPRRQTQPALTDAQVVRLVRLGRRIEAHFGRPQDIEWCLAGDDFHIVQSRPITTLFPIPAADDQENHVYVSVGHQQMMTDAIKPLGLSLWQLTTPRPMHEAGGRLFVDVAPALATPAGRADLFENLGKSDPLIADALQSVLDRGDFVRPFPGEGPGAAPAGDPPAPIETDPAVVTRLIRRNQASVATLQREIQGLSGPALFDFILADIAEMRRLLFDPQSFQVIMAGMEAAWWLNDRLEAWLGEKNAAGALMQSVPRNVTSEMGLALLDVADTIRPHADVVAYLHRVADEGRQGDGFLNELAGLDGGQEACDAIRGFLDQYGMRCAGEIDITRIRWSEQPATLVPAVLGNVKNFESGAGKRHFEQGRQESRRKEQELLTRLRALPRGEQKAEETKRMIDRARTFAGYREYPKYGMVSRYFVYKQALLREADRLVRSGALREKEDVFFLRFQEVQEAVRTGEVDAGLIRERREAFRSYEALTPPRVLTSDGEAVTGRYRRDDFPPGALAGLAVSAGTVEGRARVVMDMAQADLEAGDILVTAYTDPSWTPLFVTAAGLVTEVGGLMTHGAVIAREYGLPAVVGVEQATRLIRDGQRIRVDGTDGYVQILT
ncbi:rifamycin-inactivating phosphotransferase [Planomonospora venezuelensis]|uniref:Rifampicin phosphotransferase n=1 Tax=Planomonospora venezuelensis TaxID=1999 RepID=A0A841DG16_PLAVE|nr:rifamycin-inactivating phosphotransferase [Planomonospora venezuelensis]MBB5966166.1 pyruvate,water dikinase [Planomonospora venezuelensis]GIN05803.1 putative phosphoenolpyruvate synthase [Planomonospora venezuelensis]